MYFEKAIALKNEISENFLKSRKMLRSISIAGNTHAFDYSVHSLGGVVNGAGLVEMTDGSHAIKLMVKTNLQYSPSALRQYYGLRKRDIFMECSGPVEFKNRIRSPYPGLSIGHYKVTAGTLGCFVTDKKGTLYVLSNNHILADSGRGKWRDPVLQPGPEDGGTTEHDLFASLSYVVPFRRHSYNLMDAAIARVEGDAKLDTRISQKVRVKETGMPSLKMKVEKYGRTTGRTIGEVTTTHLDVNVELNGMQLEFHDQFEIKGCMHRGSRTKFCGDGDSGSLILEKGTNRAIGLLFAGTKNGTTFATPISCILDAFSVNIL